MVCDSLTLIIQLHENRSGLVYIIGRQLYAYMYQRHGPKARLYGALLLNSSLILNLGLIIYGSLRTLGYMA